MLEKCLGKSHSMALLNTFQYFSYFTLYSTGTRARATAAEIRVFPSEGKPKETPTNCLGPEVSHMIN